MHESIVFCSTFTMSSYRKFTFAISSPDEFLVYYKIAIIFVIKFSSSYSSCSLGIDLHVKTYRDLPRVTDSPPPSS